MSVIRQNPTPQLNVFNISISLIFLLFNHLKILGTLIFDKSILTVKFFGTDAAGDQKPLINETYIIKSLHVTNK